MATSDTSGELLDFTENFAAMSKVAAVAVRERASPP